LIINDALIKDTFKR